MAKIKKQKTSDGPSSSPKNRDIAVNEKSANKVNSVNLKTTNGVIHSDKKNRALKKKAQKSELKVLSKSIKKVKKSKGDRIGKVDPSELIDELLRDVDSAVAVKKETDPFQGFKVIKWQLNEKSETIHHLFIKKHEMGIAELSKEKPPGRTILCHNIPSYFNEGHVRDIFQSFGSIEKIFVHQNPTATVPDKPDRLFPTEKDTIRGFRVAYVVYTDNKTVKDLIEMNSEDVEPIVLERLPNAGVPRWMNEYNSRVVPKQMLEKAIRKFMDNFDKEELKRKEMEKNANEPDDEGWVTVTRTGKRASGGLVRSEAMEERLRAKKRRQERQLLNFTPAQVKESKMKQLVELKKKFEEDKQRVALLKQQRKFKPF